TEEIKEMEKASREMVFIYDNKKGIIAQDSSFLTKAKWPEVNDSRPLLLHYHPLTIYRHQILKQADTVLALLLLGDEDQDIIRRTFYYYEDINTHDSSLSKCISGIIASSIGDNDLAYKLFMDTVYMDLKNLNHNTPDGLHMANIGGSILSVIKGFAGLRIKEDGLYLNPNVPKELGRIRFRFTWRDSLLEVVMEEDNIEVRKISGPSRNIFIKGEKILMPQKAVLFDLDGVLTSTSDNHYEAWKKMMKELGHDLP